METNRQPSVILIFGDETSGKDNLINYLIEGKEEHKFIDNTLLKQESISNKSEIFYLFNNNNNPLVQVNTQISCYYI